MLPDVGDFLEGAYWLWALLGCVLLFAPYFMFQKHWLPHCLGKWVGRLYFWPCIPCSVYGNKKEFKGEWCGNRALSTCRAPASRGHRPFARCHGHSRHRLRPPP